MSQAIQNAAIALAHAILAEVKMGGPASTPEQNPASLTAAPADPFGGLTAGTVAPAIAPVEVTPMMIQELIIPLISNPAAKTRLQVVMQEMNIPELPAARPDQLPALYAKFKAVADEVNGSAGTPATSGGVNLI